MPDDRLIITFVTRRDCPLCDEALPHVERWCRRFGFELAIRDVDAEGLADTYGDRVPVVLGPEGNELLAGRFGQANVAAALWGVRVRNWG